MPRNLDMITLQPSITKEIFAKSLIQGKDKNDKLRRKKSEVNII